MVSFEMNDRKRWTWTTSFSLSTVSINFNLPAACEFIVVVAAVPPVSKIPTNNNQINPTNASAPNKALETLPPQTISLRFIPSPLLYFIFEKKMPCTCRI